VNNLKALTPDSLGHPKRSVDVPVMIHHLHERKQHAYDVVQLLSSPKTKMSNKEKQTAFIIILQTNYT